MRNRLAGTLAAAGALITVPLAAQTTAPDGTAPRDTAAQAPAPKITPKQVIDLVKTLTTPKPTPTPTPTPIPAPVPTPTLAPQPVPTAATNLAPKPVPARPVASAPAPRVPSVPPPAVVVVEPDQVMDGDPPPDLIASEAPAPPIPEPIQPTAPWPWVAAVLAALGLGEFARRWFWPKAAINLEIAAGESAITGGSSPALAAPDVIFDIRIELGEVSTPAGGAVLAQEDRA